MMCGMSDPGAPPASLPATPREPRIHWWSRVSPWWWGLLMLVALWLSSSSGCHQSPRIRYGTGQAELDGFRRPSLAGPVYTQPSPTRVTSTTPPERRGPSTPRFARKGLSACERRWRDFRRQPAERREFYSCQSARSRPERACLRGAVFTAAELAGRTLPSPARQVQKYDVRFSIGGNRMEIIANPAACPRN